MRNNTLNNSKIIVLLRRFDKKELKYFEAIIDFSLHNGCEKVIQLIAHQCIKMRANTASDLFDK